MKRRILFRSTATGLALAALAAQPAIAQDQTYAEESHAGLADIIVTAQRRAENLQDVAISITAVDGAALAEARVENIANIQSISPSVTFRVANMSTSSANIIIRGLGTTGNSRSFEGSVGVFIDGVYRTRAAAALQNFLDIDNLQILRGPQGTLFGKNTTAGAILLTSADPKLYDFGGMVDLSYGNYNAITARGAVNIPLGDQVAVRVSGLASNHDGFFRNPTTGGRYNNDSTRAIKGQLLWEPSDDVRIRLIGDYSQGTGHCCYATGDFIDGPTQPLIDGLTQAWGGVVPTRGKLSHEQTLNGNGHQSVKDYGSTLLIEAELAGGTLNSTTAWRKFAVDQRDMDADFTGADILRISEDFNSRFISQELTWTAPIDAINADLVLGAFFSDEKLTINRQMPWGTQAQAYWDVILAGQGLPPGTANAEAGPRGVEEMHAKSKSYAAFAHLDAKVTDQFSVIAGIRYSVEKKTGEFEYVYYRPHLNDPFRILGNAPGPNYNASITGKAVSGTFGLQFRPVDDVMLYATYNRGFKAGGVNMDGNAGGGRFNNPNEVPGAVPLDPTYRPEKVNAFEVGAKMQYLDGRARTNIAAFYYDISDLQVAQFLGTQFTVLNAKSAKNYGIEIENLFQLSEGLTLGIDGTWIPHAKYGADPLLAVVLQETRFRFAPKIQGNVTLNLDQPVADNLDLVGRIQYQYSGSQLLTTSSSTLDRGGIGIINGNLGFSLPESGLRVEGWVQNLTNKIYVNYAYSSPLQAGDFNAYLASPRTFGIRLHADF